MKIDSKDTLIAYRCPKCGQAILSVEGVISLSASLFRIKCPCGESEALVEKTAGRVTVEYPCIMCGEKHKKSFDTASVFGTDIIKIPCPYTGIDTLFVGKKEKMSDELDKNAEEINSILEMNGIEDYHQLQTNSEYTLTDPEDDNLVKFVLKELEDEGAIRCRCSDGKGDTDFRFMNNDVMIFCKKCGASTLVPIADRGSKEKFIKTDELILK